MVGLLLTALVTGLVFAKFSRSAARVSFSQWATIAPMDGVPTLMIRVGNDRNNRIIEAELRVALTRTEKTREGTTFYRMIDLTLTRSRAPVLSRGWTVMHTITADSPLHGMTPASLREEEVELLVTLAGVDDLTLQPTHAQNTYLDAAILWGRRHADMLRELPDGSLAMDLSHFHELEETDATAEFPYGHGAAQFGDAAEQLGRRARPR